MRKKDFAIGILCWDGPGIEEPYQRFQVALSAVVDLLGRVHSEVYFERCTKTYEYMCIVDIYNVFSGHVQL